ncbi:MAG: Ig-like domain-containing protein [Pseudomonadota bacterium]
MRKKVVSLLIGPALVGLAASPASMATEGIASPLPTPTLAADGSVVPAEANYIVVLKAPAVANFEGNPEYAAPERANGRLDVNGAASVAYTQFLQGQQSVFVDSASQRLGRSVAVANRMQHAINAVILRLTPAEAAAVKEMPEVRMVEPPRNYELDTDVGPGLINAPGIWDGTNTDGAPGTLGEGMVVGIIDSGINHDHPSFAEVSEPGTGDEYTHTNPLGSGNFLGFCADNPASLTYTCNDKLIGAYEFTFPLVSGDPDALEDEEPDDENGHGTHVASTAIGNPVTANYLGVDPDISGVAPQANVIAYDVCYTQISSGLGLCPNAATLAGINQAVADGIVDVVNYSISGGAQPWDEANSLAFLNAVEAGIFVSASAGNSGPGPDTLGHQEPWVASVAAASHGRFFSDASLDAGTQTGVGAIEGSGPVTLTGALADDIRFFATNPEGCTSGGGIDANFFDDGGDGTIALISRGSCGFAEKIDNAAAAGARGVVVFNNRAGAPFSMGALDTTTIPGVMISQADGETIRDEIIVNDAVPTATAATITPVTPAVPSVDPASADIVAAFSSRGPNDENIVKPDIAAPGVSILAAFADGNGASGAPEFEILQGTSMSSPHNAGAATLLRALEPSWTPSEVKSALMMTADPNMQDDNGDGTVGTATPLDMGAGRVDLTDAALVPIVLDEAPTRYLAADPDAGGDARTLNLASMSDDACGQTCSWTRTIRSVADAPVDFTITFVGDGEMTGTVTPSTFTLLPGLPQTLTIEADTSAVTTRDEWKFGSVSLANTAGDTLRMPVTVFPVGPAGTVTPDALAVTLDPDTTGDVTIDIASTGGADLNFTINPNPQGGTTVLDQPQVGFSGIFSRVTPDNAIIAADDLILGGTTTLTSVSAVGFQNGNDLINTASTVALYVWEDAGGIPAGSPFDLEANAVLELVLPVPTTGLSLDNDTITFDLVALSETITLDAGTYWIGVLPNSLLSWGWFYGPQGVGTAGPLLIGPDFGAVNWTPFTAFNIFQDSLALEVNAQVDCGAAWLSENPTAGAVPSGDGTSVTVTADATGFTRGTFLAFECVETDAETLATAVVPVTMTVNNTPPVVAGETLALDEGTSATAVDGDESSLLANDSDFDTDPLTVSMVAATEPSNGTVTLNADGTFEYMHDGSETISDSFDYEVCDNAPVPGCATGTVAVTVNPLNDPPTAVGESLTVAENGATDTLDGGETSLLANDSDAEMDEITASATPAVAPTNGTVTINPDGTFEYVHDGSETSSDSFDYEVCDATQACSTATVTVAITNVNAAPMAQADTIRVVVGATATETADGEDSVLANDVDPEGDNMTVNTTPLTAPTAGDLTLNADGTFSYSSTGTEAGSDSFSYEVCDDGQPQECSSGDVSVDIIDDVILADGFEEQETPDNN